MDIYAGIRAEMLPTPAKSHYTFNLRDISRVVQGMLQITPPSAPTPTPSCACGSHEAIARLLRPAHQRRTARGSTSASESTSRRASARARVGPSTMLGEDHLRLVHEHVDRRRGALYEQLEIKASPPSLTSTCRTTTSTRPSR